MKRLSKEVKNNELVYTYEVENKNRVSYLVFNSYRIFKNSISAFGGWSMDKKCYYVEIHYAM